MALVGLFLGILIAVFGGNAEGTLGWVMLIGGFLLSAYSLMLFFG